MSGVLFLRPGASGELRRPCFRAGEPKSVFGVPINLLEHQPDYLGRDGPPAVHGARRTAPGAVHDPVGFRAGPKFRGKHTEKVPETRLFRKSTQSFEGNTLKKCQKRDFFIVNPKFRGKHTEKVPETSQIRKLTQSFEGNTQKKCQKRHKFVS